MTDCKDECPELYGTCPKRYNCELYQNTIGFEDEVEAKVWENIPIAENGENLDNDHEVVYN